MIQASGYFKGDLPLIKGEEPTTVKIDGSIEKGDLYSDLVELEYLSQNTFSEISSFSPYCCAFSPNGNYFAVSIAISPFLAIYKRNGDTFTKLSNPSVLPSSYARFLNWSPDSTILVLLNNSSPYITIYKRSGDTFTKLSNPSVLPVEYAEISGTFSNDGKHFLIGTYKNFYAYKINGDVFTSINPPDINISQSYYSFMNFSYSKDNSILLVQSAHSPYIFAFKCVGDTFTSIGKPTLLNTGTNPHIFFVGDYLVYPLSNLHSATSSFVYTYTIDSSGISTQPLNTNAGFFSMGYLCSPIISNIDDKEKLLVFPPRYQTIFPFNFYLIKENYVYFLNSFYKDESILFPDNLSSCSFYDKYAAVIFGKKIYIIKYMYKTQKVENSSFLDFITKFGYSLESKSDSIINSMNILRKE